MAFIKAVFWSLLITLGLGVLTGFEEVVALMVGFFVAMTFVYPIQKWALPAKREHLARLKAQAEGQ